MKKILKTNRGDTIVEVLISIAIVSLVLAISYATANKDTLSIQDAQERSQAIQLVQRQIEFVKANNGLVAGKTCYASTGVPSTGAACDVSDSGAPTTVEPIYHLSVSPSGGTYTISVHWASLIGSNDDNVSIFYRP